MEIFNRFLLYKLGKLCEFGCSFLSFKTFKSAFNPISTKHKYSRPLSVQCYTKFDYFNLHKKLEIQTGTPFVGNFLNFVSRWNS